MTLLLVGCALLGRRPLPTTAAGTPPPTSSERTRGLARLSIVVWASTIGAVAGPNLTGLGVWTPRSCRCPS
jgi:hypothetical protein